MAGDLGRRSIAEFLGSAMLAGTVVGSGILASRLAGGNDAVALLGNTIATGAILFVLITALGPISGAHLNPAVSLVMALRGELGLAALALYCAAQVMGCATGAMLAHAMFELPLLQRATQVRHGMAQNLSEGVATFVLLFVILTISQSRARSLAAAVALTITAGYWWTASTSFANPAITIARTLSDTFAGVRLEDAPGFVAGQIVGALAAFGVCSLMLRRRIKACGS